MDLTILIPVHRNESTIGRTLASINSAWQSAGRPSGLHVIVVIDGIIDSSIDVVEGWAGTTPVPATVIVQENRGVASARNTAWRAASTPWITFLDADDEMTPERLDFAEHKLRAGSVFIGRQELSVQDGASVPGTRNGRSPDFLLVTMILERSTLEGLGGLNESLKVGDDWDLMIRMKEHGIPVAFVDACFVARHIHGGNASYDEAAVSREYLRAIREYRRRITSLQHPPDPA